MRRLNRTCGSLGVGLCISLITLRKWLYRAVTPNLASSASSSRQPRHIDALRHFKELESLRERELGHLKLAKLQIENAQVVEVKLRVELFALLVNQVHL